MQTQLNTNTQPPILQPNKGGIYRSVGKRGMDILLSLLAIIGLSVIILIVAILVRMKLGSPIIFKQQRPGLNEKIFTMYKFRTMTDERDENGELLPDSVRLTKFGRLLRRTSLDELPELINILKGDMSIIGPRPLAVEYLPYYNEKERVRHSIRPGLSGLAQINGRNTADWERRFYYDIQYVNEISLIGDIKIIWCTILKAVKRSDIGERGVDSPPDFHIYRQKSLKGEKYNEY
ncbi:sugar transferase [Metabacillus iocasae]|uniref:Lipopolysaccharide/colanic/teichoic acid biosynthesis glycosyltransferase n=1 Tax=Priestia iocasae TaxID=2291674 RepID=A0ABS2QS80_9BACI|nr:sugar transferase [Metabacillus iocasae]MBM7702311.1 lipopolysaccharide/colanic/teichoic acid biosynthesis glycosyltransferase [Metabacillus iocasae]